jgi:hypothetical protein
MSSPTGKTLHELNALNPIDIQDTDLILIGDASEPLISKATSVGNLKIALGTWSESGNTENLELENPTWVLEGAKGYWRINILSAIENALAYLIWYYDEVAETWVLYPKAITETRSTLGMSGGPLYLDIFVERNAVTGIAPRTRRRFKIQTVTSLEKSGLSTEQAAYTIAALPANFVPNAPDITETEDYPYTQAKPKYMTFGHSVVLRITAPTGQGDYVSRYELQRRSYVEGQSAKAGWVTLPMHTLTLDLSKPSPTILIYTDDSAAAAPGDVLDYRARVVDTNGTPSAWCTPITYTVEEDDIAPDAPVLTVYQVQLGLRIVISAPTQNEGEPCSDVRHWIIYGRKGSEAYANILGPNGVLSNQETTYAVPDASLASSYQFKAMAVDWAGNESEWSEPTSALAANPITMNSVDASFTSKLAVIDSTASTVSSHTTSISQNAQAIELKASTTDVNNALGAKADIESLISLINLSAEGVTISSEKTEITGAINGKADTSQLISLINASAEGITISSSKTEVTGAISGKADSATIIATINVSPEEVTISAGKVNINGSTDFIAAKLAKVGGSYESAASGARVRIFPDANTGILVTDGTNDVFKCLVGGTDVGDVVIGSEAGQYVKWDKSASELIIVGLLKTDSGSERLQFITVGDPGGTYHQLSLYNSDTMVGSILAHYDGGQIWLSSLTGNERTGFYNYSSCSVNNYTAGTAAGIYSAGELKINGTKVIGAQGAAVADATGAGDIVAQFNTLLARARAHGWIAT